MDSKRSNGIGGSNYLMHIPAGDKTLCGRAKGNRYATEQEARKHAADEGTCRTCAKRFAASFQTLPPAAPDYDIVAEYLTKLDCARTARKAGNYALTQAYERQAMDRWKAMTRAVRAEVGVRASEKIRELMNAEHAVRVLK